MERKRQRFVGWVHAECPYYRTHGTGRARSWSCAIDNRVVLQAWGDCWVRLDSEEWERFRER